MISKFLFQYRILLKQETTKLTVRTAVNLSFKVIGEGTTNRDKPPILVLHGLLGSKKQWKGIGKTIRNITKRTIIAVDLRNHGASPHFNSQTYDEMAGDIIQILNKLDVNSVSLVGHSIGGRTAMCTALLAPKKVAGLLVVDISPVSTCEQMKDMAKVLSAMKAVNFKSTNNLSEAKKEAKKQLMEIVNDESTMSAVLSNVRVYGGKIGWICKLDMLLKHFHHLTSFPKRMVKGKKYNGPCLFIGGQLSEYIPPSGKCTMGIGQMGIQATLRSAYQNDLYAESADDLTGIREMFPRAVITYIPKTGHNLHIEDPKTFLERAIAFLKSNH